MKILLIQLRRIGDILLSTPVISYLKKTLPEAQIDFLCESMGKTVLETHPDLKEVLLYDKSSSVKEILRIRERRYDAVIDFMGNPRTALLTGFSGAKRKIGFRFAGRSFFYNVRIPVPAEPEYVSKRKFRLVLEYISLLGISFHRPSSYRPVLYLTTEDERFAQKWLEEKRLKTKSFVVLAPAHRHPIRQWHAEGFRDVGLKIKQTGIPVFLAWGPSEERVMAGIRKGYEKELELLPATSLRQMAAILKTAKGLLTNDSGAMHLAVSVGTPTVTIYGPTRPIDWNPSFLEDDGHDIPLTAQNVPCLGCHRSRCPVGHICMSHLSVEDVYQACRIFLRN